MKRIGILLLCVAILVLFLARGDERADPPAEGEPDPAAGPVVVPMPAPKRRTLEERARGLYMLAADGIRVTLDLRPRGSFHFLSVRPDGVSRNASGTWHIAQRGLVLTYTHVNDQPMPNGPQSVVNRWLGNRIELADTGLSEAVVLTKRSVIRQR